MGRKLASLNRYISVIIDIDGKWFVIFEQIINHLCFGYIRLPQPVYYFSCFFFYTFLFFFHFSHTIYFCKFERLRISLRTFVRQKSGVPGWGDFSQLGPPRF